MHLTNKYLVLYANCVPIKGACRSTICDLQRERYIYIPNSMYDVIDLLKNMPVNEYLEVLVDEDSQGVLEYISYILEQEMGFLTQSPEEFPQINFNYDTPTLLNDFIVEYSNDVDIYRDKLIKGLEFTGVQCLEVRLTQSDIFLAARLLQSIKNTRIRSVQVISEFEDKSITFLQSLLENYPFVTKIIVHKVPETATEIPVYLNKKMVFTHDFLGNEHCGVIQKVANLKFVSLALNANSCLGYKLALDSKGFYKNCPSLPHKLGHIATDSIESILTNPTYLEYANVKKQEINICKECELRLICSDCRAHGVGLQEKPRKCNYDPYNEEIL